MKRKDAGRPRARPAGDYADPYKPARRPLPGAGDSGPEARRPPPGRRPPRDSVPPRGDRDDARPARQRDRPGQGFTVTLDADVARVFRGEASVNRALRLVMQLMQVVQGPARAPGGPAGRTGAPRRPGYQGSAEARGFTRKPRFQDDEQ